MKLEVLSIEGKSTGKSIELPDNVYAIEPNDHVLYLSVKSYLANQRQGTHKTKQRNEVSGSTKKLHKQKGTGGSRKGSIKNPVYGNGRAHGPQPRDYSFKLNKKVKTLACKSALSYKLKENNIFLLEDFSLDQIKTKSYINILNNLNIVQQKSILVLPDYETNIYLSARNIPNTKVVKASELNPYDVLNCEKLLLCEASIEKLTQRLSIQ
jgi:large subunit ribosomal protein L4